MMCCVLLRTALGYPVPEALLLPSRRAEGRGEEILHEPAPFAGGRTPRS